MIDCSRGMVDDVPRSAGSATCSETSAGASCCWGTCQGGEGTSCVWASGEEGDDSTWIGDAGRGGGDGAVLWRFGCDLVLSSLSLSGLGGIGTCLSTSGLSRIVSLLLQQPKLHE